VTLKAVRNWKGNNNFFPTLIIYAPSFVFVILALLSSESTFSVKVTFFLQMSFCVEVHVKLHVSTCTITHQYM